MFSEHLKSRSKCLCVFIYLCCRFAEKEMFGGVKE